MFFDPSVVASPLASLPSSLGTCRGRVFKKMWYTPVDTGTHIACGSSPHVTTRLTVTGDNVFLEWVLPSLCRRQFIQNLKSNPLQCSQRLGDEVKVNSTYCNPKYLRRTTQRLSNHTGNCPGHTRTNLVPAWTRQVQPLCWGSNLLRNMAASPGLATQVLQAQKPNVGSEDYTDTCPTALT